MHGKCWQCSDLIELVLNDCNFLTMNLFIMHWMRGEFTVMMTPFMQVILNLWIHVGIPLLPKNELVLARQRNQKTKRKFFKGQTQMIFPKLFVKCSGIAEYNHFTRSSVGCLKWQGDFRKWKMFTTCVDLIPLGS